MDAYWGKQSAVRRWTIIAVLAFVSFFIFSFIFAKETQTAMPHQLAQCYELIESTEIGGDAITQSLGIARHFYTKQKDSRRDALTKAIEKSSNVKPRDVLLYLVPEVACLGRVRVGSTGDGGKWMCNPWRAPQDCVVYSLGSSDDISFERDMNELTSNKCAIVTVDMDKPTESTRKTMLEQGIKFVQGKISAETDVNKAEYTIEHLMNTYKHEKIDVLKMDIEGSEFTVLPKFMKDHTVCQLLIEIHKMQRVAWLLREIANNGYLLINFEINANHMQNGLSEYSFIHSTCLGAYESHYLSGFIHS